MLSIAAGAGTTIVFAIVLWLPAWWLAGRIDTGGRNPFFRLLISLGIALTGYLSFVNLLGRLTEQSVLTAQIYFALNSVACVTLWRWDRNGIAVGDLLRPRRTWFALLAIATVAAVPQWLLGVSTPYWDEVASGAIHLTAPNQFADGLFPPRYNAFPDLPIKYHYGSTILVGTLRWLTGLSSNACIDLVSTALWYFVFLFIFAWFRALKFCRLTAGWASAMPLLGGGLAWLYIPWLETYVGFQKTPGASLLSHRFAPEQGWWENLRALSETPVFHLRNADGSLSNLPWDIFNQFQQHAVALSLALTVFAAFLFCEWRSRDRPSAWLVAGNAVCFGVLILSHAVIGAIACLTAGILLVIGWLRAPTKQNFWPALAFTMVVTALSFGHGGMLSFGAGYETEVVRLVPRIGFGYSAGGALGFMHWNIAGFGVILIGALWALASWPALGVRHSEQRQLAFAFFAVMLVVSYLPPQFFYYAYGSRSVEEYTEIAKFFFASHLSLAFLSAYGVATLARVARAAVITVLLPASLVTPLAHVYAGAFYSNAKWKGFYTSPYLPKRVPDHIAIGRALDRLKKTNRDVFYDASGHLHSRGGYLSEMLVFGGSVFTTTPRRYERTGAYPIPRKTVAERERQNGLLARLSPGSFRAVGARWLFARPEKDFDDRPLIVRSRFAKALAEGYFLEVARSGERALIEVIRSTRNIDRGISRYWRPHAILQARSDWDSDGRIDLNFYDVAQRVIITGTARIPLPRGLGKGFAQIYVGRFPGDRRADLLAAVLSDTFTGRGETSASMVKTNSFRWLYRDSRTGSWGAPHERWDWMNEVPIIADTDGDGFDSRIAFQPSTGRWLGKRGEVLADMAIPANLRPRPVAGRFHGRSTADLGVWSAVTGEWWLRNPADGTQTRFRLGRPGDILVPGDYDGDGVDEAAVYTPSDRTWRLRDVATGETTSWRFGAPGAIPLPADYDDDGRVDAAYWLPKEGRIHVSFSSGTTRQTDRTIVVPPGAIPAFVNMY